MSLSAPSLSKKAIPSKAQKKSTSPKTAQSPKKTTSTKTPQVKKKSAVPKATVPQKKSSAPKPSQPQKKSVASKNSPTQKKNTTTKKSPEVKKKATTTASKKSKSTENNKTASPTQKVAKRKNTQKASVQKSKKSSNSKPKAKNKNNSPLSISTIIGGLVAVLVCALSGLYFFGSETPKKTSSLKDNQTTKSRVQEDEENYNSYGGIRSYARISDAPKGAELFRNKRTGEIIDISGMPSGYKSRYSKNKTYSKVSKK